LEHNEDRIVNRTRGNKIKRPICFSQIGLSTCHCLERLVASAATAAASAAVIAATSTTAAAAGTALLCLEAIAAEYWAIASGFEGNRCLLAAAGTDNRCSCGGAGAIATAASAVAASAAAKAAASAGLVSLLGLSARLAALRRRISPFLKERLVSSSKCEFPSAVATGKLQISSHGGSPF
jgi:hypothetical protein